MKIAVFGAAGDVGSRIVREALSRDHDVTAVSRTPLGLTRMPVGVRPILADAEDTREVTLIAAGHDLVISALRPSEGREDILVGLTGSMLRAAADANVRLLITGGAASLKLADRPNHTVLSAPGFLPAAVRPIAQASQAQYLLCMADNRADWTYLTPPAMLEPGERLGRYRTGSDTLLVDGNGHSRISMEDFAVAMIDEAEQPKHRRKRFTVAY